LQKASFGASNDDDLVNNDNTLTVLADSGSNINIIQQKDIRFWGIPETYENKPGRLNGIGTLPTLGVIGLAIPLQGKKMIDGIMKPHVHVYTCDALLINDDTGPKCTLLSSVQSEQMGYTWESSRTLCTLTAPDGTKIPLTRNRLNGFWYFNAIKRHHDTELTRDEIARQIRHNKSTSLYLGNATECNSEAKQQIYRTQWLQDHLQKGDIKIHHLQTSLNMGTPYQTEGLMLS
jgi:hypothetical protein